MKKLISLFLAFFVVLALFPVTTLAAVSGEFGNGLTYSLDDGGVLTICGNGEITFEKEYHAPWFKERANVTAVIIENGVTNVGSNAFYGCNN